jgi:predicted transcriptional regulator
MQSEIETGRKVDTNEVEINRRSVMSKNEAE